MTPATETVSPVHDQVRENGATEQQEDGAIQRLERRIRDMMGNRVRAFQLLRAPRGLLLKGQTRTYYAKQLAQQLVMQASQEPILANDIEVA